MTNKRYRHPRRLRYVPKRLRKPPPFETNHTLRGIGLGLTIGEGSAGCTDRSPLIEVKLCDKKAVEMVSKSWGTAILRSPPLECKPTPTNPEGRAYRTRAVGTRADIIMKQYEPEITGTEIHQSYQTKKQECPKRLPYKRKKPSEP